MSPDNFKLPNAEADSFAFPYNQFFRPNVDPAVILRFLPDEVVIQLAAAYEAYNAKAADLGAQALQAKSQLHKQLADIIGKSKR